MRPAGRAETESLYFNYPQFGPPKGAARDGLERSVPVTIIGAGPVGMVAALTLAQQGIASVLIEAKSTFNDGSRAICMARHSYHILDSLGVVAPFLDKSLGWTIGRSFYRGEQILEFNMLDSADEKFRPMYNLQQQYIEAYLWQAIESNPLIETRWQTRLDAIAPDVEGARLSVSDPEGAYSFHADWVLAADGARSAVREYLGLRLQGQNFEGRYVIADVQMKHDYPTIRRALFDPACRPGGTVLIHRQPDNIWRIDYQLRDDEDASEAMREDIVRDSVGLVLADIGHDGPWALEWWSAYSANTLALEDYRMGCVFFIGDSAHIVPIFGVRGLNNGIADAHNIGWKLGCVLSGKAGAALLDSYTPERRGATLDAFANATKSARFMTPPSRGWRILRDAALGLARDIPFAAALANPRQMVPFTYGESPAVLPDDSDFTSGPPPGAAIFDMRLEGGFLSDRLGPWFSLICFDPRLAAEVSALPAPPKVVFLPHSSAAAKRLGANEGTAYLIRPDLHVGARWHKVSSYQVEDALRALRFLEN